MFYYSNTRVEEQFNDLRQNVVFIQISDIFFLGDFYSSTSVFVGVTFTVTKVTVRV